MQKRKEQDFIERYIEEKNVAIIMMAYYQEFGERLTTDKFKKMLLKVHPSMGCGEE